MGLPAEPAHARPFLHVSGMIRPERGCIAVMWPLATHPTNKNEIICWDLAQDPSELASIDVETLRLRLFSRAADLPEGMQRLPIKSIHVNKSPMVVGSLKTLSPAMAAQWGSAVACRSPAPCAGRAGCRPGPVRRFRGQ